MIFKLKSIFGLISATGLTVYIKTASNSTASKVKRKRNKNIHKGLWPYKKLQFSSKMPTKFFAVRQVFVLNSSSLNFLKSRIFLIQRFCKHSILLVFLQYKKVYYINLTLTVPIYSALSQIFIIELLLARSLAPVWRKIFMEVIGEKTNLKTLT